MIAALYIRVSTQEQAKEGYSIGEQKERLSLFAAAHDWAIGKAYIDPGYSGGSLDRPAIQELILDAGKHAFDKVIVYKLDRLSRSQKDTLYLIEDIFLKNGIDFVSMTENFDTASPFGKAMIGMLSVFAQLEREQIKERMQMGKDARAKEGYFHGGGYDPIGYTYKDGELIKDEYEQAQVLKIYDLAEAGISIHAIAEKMNAAGFRTRHSVWTQSSVRSVLETPIYCGLIDWKGELYPGRHDPIVSRDRFDAMQERLDLHRTRYAKHPFKRTTLLGGLLWCARCGARYFCKHNSNGLRYYTCYSRGKTAKKMIRDPNCRNKSYNVNVLDDLIICEIRKLAMDPDAIRKDAPPPSDTSGLERRSSEIDKQIGRLLDLYQTAEIDVSLLSDRIAALNTEKEGIAREIAEIKESVPSVAMSNDEIRTFAEAIDSADFEGKKHIIHSLIDAILIDGDDIEIHWLFS